MARLTKLHLKGWKSIRDAEIEFRNINVLVGGNGAGKSNLLSFFRLLNDLIGHRFQNSVQTMGGADSVLHYGNGHTQQVESTLTFRTESGINSYYSRFVPVAGNGLLIAEERLEYRRDGADVPQRESYGGNRETPLKDLALTGGAPGRLAAATLNILASCRVFHFHETGPYSPLRLDSDINLNRHLFSDGRNLPSMLYFYKNRVSTTYFQIRAAVRAVLPYFDDFVLEPLQLNPRNVELRWTSKYGPNYEFGPHQLSDGALRLIALFTLLLQPEETFPDLIVLDEPELGMHPAALSVFAEVVKGAAETGQILLATQSAGLVDAFVPEDIITVKQRDVGSEFVRLAPDSLRVWLDEENGYSLGELWGMNAFGGGPY